MKKLAITLICSILASYCYGGDIFNLDFEVTKEQKPLTWHFSDDKKLTLDNKIAQHGINSILIQSSNQPSKTEYLYNIIPAKYQGKKITLSGFVKTENVSDGYAGLFMRVNPQIDFGNMEARGVSATTAWTKYQITLDLNSTEAESILIGGELTGNGKAWFDNLRLFVDGVPIKSALLKPVLPAKEDHQFDNGSHIVISKLNGQKIEKLELLGKMWGFLKYHHSTIAKGHVNWDYELFRILPIVLTTSDHAERDGVLLNWIESLGPVALCQQCKATAADAVLKPDINWINQFKLVPALKKRLQYIYDNRHQGIHYYIGTQNDVGNPIFRNENSYKGMPYPDDAFRLLALYRYWNIIHYYFPSKHLTDKDWNDVLKEYISIFINAKNKLEYEQAALRLITEIKDGHAQTNQLWAFQDWLGKNYPPVKVMFVRDKLVVTDYYNPKLKTPTGLQIGDVITKVNGVTITDIIKSRQLYYPASNQSARLIKLSFDILRSNAKSVELNYVREQQESTLTLELHQPQELNFAAWFSRDSGNKAFELLANNIGYINLKHVQQKDIEEIKKLLHNTKGIIIDLRHYPKSFDWHSLGSFFASKVTPFARFTTINTNNPGEVNFGEIDEIPQSSITYSGKLIVIVNEESQSAAEYYTMALRAGDNTTVIGHRTAGADGNVSRFSLPGGITTAITGIGVYYPDGSQTQRIGIIPDIEVQPTIAGIKARRDELLERAITLIGL